LKEILSLKPVPLFDPLRKKSAPKVDIEQGQQKGLKAAKNGTTPLIQPTKALPFCVFPSRVLQ
jgi:hypothetical protein